VGDRSTDEQFGGRVTGRAARASIYFGLSCPGGCDPSVVGDEGRLASSRRIAQRIAHVEWGDIGDLGVTGQQVGRADHCNNLRSSAAGCALAIEAARIKPEEDVRIDEVVPLMRIRTDEARG
jgi:hypothetical protein